MPPPLKVQVLHFCEKSVVFRVVDSGRAPLGALEGTSPLVGVPWNHAQGQAPAHRESPPVQARVAPPGGPGAAGAPRGP